MKLMLVIMFFLVIVQISTGAALPRASPSISPATQLFSLLGLINEQQDYANYMWGKQAIANDTITVLRPTLESQLANYKQIEQNTSAAVQPLAGLIQQAESEISQLDQEMGQGS